MKHESMNIRRVIRANRLLAEQGHAEDTLGALDELAALRKDAERYRWLRNRLLAADWDYMGTGDTVLVFTVPAEITVSADCDATMDSAMQASKAVGAA